jgi:hypothetical protein
MTQTVVRAQDWKGFPLALIAASAAGFITFHAIPQPTSPTLLTRQKILSPHYRTSGTPCLPMRQFDAALTIVKVDPAKQATPFFAAALLKEEEFVLPVPAELRDPDPRNPAVPLNQRARPGPRKSYRWS